MLISGIPHALRKLPPPTSADDGFTGPTVAQIIEKKHPGAMFVVALVTTPAAAETMQMPPPPSFRIVRGSALAKIDFALIAPATKATPVIVNGKHDWKLETRTRGRTMGGVMDGVLYLGGDETARVSVAVDLSRTRLPEGAAPAHADPQGLERPGLRADSR